MQTRNFHSLFKGVVQPGGEGDEGWGGGGKMGKLDDELGGEEVYLEPRTGEDTYMAPRIRQCNW